VNRPLHDLLGEERVNSRPIETREADMTREAPQAWFTLSTFEKKLFSPMKDFVGAVLGNPPPSRRRPRRAARPPLPAPVAPPPPDPRRELLCELYLMMGAQSVRVFGSGLIDEFAFFQRFSVSGQHDTEFLTRLDPSDRGTENFKVWGLFRLEGESHPLANLDRSARVRDALRGYGLDRLPLARKLIAHDALEGATRLEAPISTKLFRKVGDRQLSRSDVLEILRHELSGPEKVAWVEEALPPPPPTSPLVHRYYLDRHKQAYLVRDRRGEPKRLYLAETSDDALTAVLASGRNVRKFRRS
jgi:hypothetical protein